MDGMITMDDYTQGALAYAEHDEIRDLAKAMQAGSDINNPGSAAGQGFPLRVESLDSMLRVVTFQQKDLIFWRDVPKTPAYNTVEEYNRLSSVGNESGIFVGEGELPAEDDSTYERLYTLIKFMGTVRRLSHPLLVVKKAIPDSIVAAEARAGTLKLLRGVELSLWDGDTTCMPLEFSGFFRLFIDGVAGVTTPNAAGSAAWYANVDTVLGTNLLMDMRNAPMTEDDATEIATIASEDPNHAELTDAYMPFRIAADFSKQFYQRLRTDKLAVEGEAGVTINKWNSPFGKVALKPSKFVKMSAPANQSGIGDTGRRPAPPTLGIAGVTTPVLAAGETPGFGGTVQGRTCAATIDGAGNYYFQVVACNRFGKSAPLSIGPVAVAVGDKVLIPVVDGSPAGVTEYYEIYRSLRGAAAATDAAYIMKATRSAAAQTLTDLNKFVPYTGRVYWTQRNREAMLWRQLLPLLKVNLAQIDLTVRFAMIIYGALELSAPRKHACMINVGRLV